MKISNDNDIKKKHHSDPDDDFDEEDDENEEFDSEDENEEPLPWYKNKTIWYWCGGIALVVILFTMFSGGKSDNKTSNNQNTETVKLKKANTKLKKTEKEVDRLKKQLDDEKLKNASLTAKADNQKAQNNTNDKNKVVLTDKQKKDKITQFFTILYKYDLDNLKPLNRANKMKDIASNQAIEKVLPNVFAKDATQPSVATTGDLTGNITIVNDPSDKTKYDVTVPYSTTTLNKTDKFKATFVVGFGNDGKIDSLATGTNKRV